MIGSQRHNEIDKAQWDARLMRCENRAWYAQSWVLDEAAPGWEALMDTDTGALMPLTWRRRFGVSYLYQPYGLQQLGVFAPRTEDVVLQHFLDAIPARFRYWDFCLNTAFQAVEAPRTTTVTNVDQLLPLEQDPAIVRKAYSENHRRNVRKSEVVADLFTTDIDAREFVALFDRTTGERFGSNAPRDMRTMQGLIEGAMQRGQGKLTGIRKDGVLCAAVCFITWQGRTILFKSASDARGHEMKAMFHLVDRHIAEVAGECTVLDFAGSNTPSVARFNAGFGARSSVYLRLRRNGLPFPLNLFKQ